MKVNKRSYGTLRAMFPNTPEERRKEVDWDVFVAALGEAGFAARSGGGSMVSFKERAGTGTIIFHKPHPTPKIDPIMLQSMGKRMNKWFRWHRGVFAVVEKGDLD
ncbi:hypothetical protein M011DRAFT_507399 [Sporormia fimetaria CBS 119925]|uniref:Type II toxin-antitoxin system HicA family toxin n=1 Tax=Sporormia fimetaria CBS 119925 TaxID=1340428 RepID=A0A6A6VMJ4_9PLEO|nr:hypothetical protein M011DRAFT_507399 [Sporormia fimetaria CBS 119925]